MAQLTGFLDWIVLPQASNSGPGAAVAAGMTLEMLATSTYEEGTAMVIAHARDCLGHKRVQSICNAIVGEYFCKTVLYPQAPRVDLLSTLRHTHIPSTGWQPGSKLAIGVPGIDDQELLEIVCKHAGLFKHDVAMRGFNLQINCHNTCARTPAGWTVSPL